MILPLIAVPVGFVSWSEVRKFAPFAPAVEPTTGMTPRVAASALDAKSSALANSVAPKPFSLMGRMTDCSIGNSFIEARELEGRARAPQRGERTEIWIDGSLVMLSVVVP